MPKGPANRSKRAPLNLRTTDKLRAKLDRAAKTSGRTLTGEVEYRIEQSFDRIEVVTALSDIVQHMILRAHADQRLMLLQQFKQFAQDAQATSASTSKASGAS